MVEFRTLRFLLAAGALAASLCACGGSDNGATAVTAVKTASWTDVSVRALDGKINLSWEKGVGTSFGPTAPTYNIYCSTTSSDLVREANRIATNYAGQSFDHTNVTNGVRYYYAVTAVTATGEGPASNTVSAYPQAALPAPPYGLKVTALDSSVKLELRGPTPVGAAGVVYNLYRSTTRGGFVAGNRILSGAPASQIAPYLDLHLDNGTTYHYAVSAVISGKESGFSPTVSARPQAVTAPLNSTPSQLARFASPAQMSAAAGNGYCDLSWSDVAPITISQPDPAASATPATPDYTLYWSDLPDVLDNPIDSVVHATKSAESGTFRITGLNNGAMYYIQVVAAVKDSDGNPIPGRFTPGPVVSVTPSPKTPAVPSGLAATHGEQQVSLDWNKDASGLTGVTVTYNVYFSTTAPATAAELVAKGTRKNNEDSTKPYYTHTGLQPGATYYYVVTAVGEGESAPSPVVSVTL